MSDGRRDALEELKAAIRECAGNTIHIPDLTDDQINLLLITIETHSKGRAAWRALRERLGMLRAELVRKLQ